MGGRSIGVRTRTVDCIIKIQSQNLCWQYISLECQPTSLLTSKFKPDVTYKRDHPKTIFILRSLFRTIRGFFEYSASKKRNIFCQMFTSHDKKISRKKVLAKVYRTFIIDSAISENNSFFSNLEVVLDGTY